MTTAEQRWPRNGVSTLKTPGLIYFAQGEGGGPIKIGWAVNPAKRLADMQSHSPVRLKLLYWYPGDGKAERMLHDEFAADRLHGEWFAESVRLLQRARDLSAPHMATERQHAQEAAAVALAAERDREIQRLQQQADLEQEIRGQELAAMIGDELAGKLSP